MAEGERSPPELQPARRVKTPAVDFIDYGVAPLELPGGPETAAEITEFLDPKAHSGTASATQSRSASASTLGFIRRALFATFGFIVGLVRSLFGIASLVLLLAVIAAVPGVNILALGYLLEVEGRMARTGKLRDAFPLVDLAPRLGSIALGIWAFVFPLRFLSFAAADARLIDPGSAADIGLHIVVPVAAVIVAVHLCLALSRGGSLWTLIWPLATPLAVLAAIPVALLTVALMAQFVAVGLAFAVLMAVLLIRRNTRAWLIARLKKLFVVPFIPVRQFVADLRRLRTPEYWNQASTAVRDFIAALRLRHHFLLGLKGFIGAFMWLFTPTLLFAATTKTEGGPIIVTLFGGILVMIVLSWVPFLQAHFAAENRFGAMFELRKVRKLYLNAPFSWLITMLVTLTFALPMYLFKVALPPSDAMFLETIVFIVSIYPLKVLTGWAYHRAVTRERRAFFGLRWLTRVVMVPLLALYVFLLFFTQFIGQHGKLVLFEHHAFLLPGPF
jgi:hypothetical protein